MNTSNRKHNGQFCSSHSQIRRGCKNDGRFKKGHQGNEKMYEREMDQEPLPIRRLDKRDFSMVVKQSKSGGLVIPDAEDRPGPSKILRPRGQDMVPDLSTEYTGSTDGNISDEMRLVCNSKSADMWNTAFKEHTSRAGCDFPHFTVDKEIKKGLGWKQSLRCVNCAYTSPVFKLYTEVQNPGPGAKRAACNVGLQVGLQDSPIGNTKARMLIAATNTPPPARSSMQTLSNSVGEAITDLNNKDMSERRAQCQRVNELRGLPRGDPINISLDVRYNSNTIVSRHKMGQNASQAIGVAIEHQTADKKIIGLHIENKLCWVGSWLRNNGFDIQCPGHPDCTATVNSEDPFSERVIGQKIGDDIADDGLLIRYVITDGDARSAEGVQKAMERTFPGCTVERQADTTHLGQSQVRHAIKATFSDGMFPGQTTERRKEQQKILAMDLKTRCHSVMGVLLERHAGDMKTIARKMPTIVATMVDCYGGDCRRCRYHGIVCRGGKKTGWWSQSPYLWNCGLRALDMTDSDRTTLENLIKLRLGVDALRLTRLNLNTNKNEAVNRALSVSLPKNVNYSRNAVARASSTIHRLNMGAGNSLIKKLETVGSPITRGHSVARAVKHMNTASTYHITYTKRKITQQRRRYNKVRQMRAYLRAKYTRRAQGDYVKGQLDPQLEDPLKVDKTTPYHLRERRPRHEHDDHPYTKPQHYL